MSDGLVDAPPRSLDALGRTLNTGRVNLWCAEEGDGPPLVLLGGFTAGHYVWELAWPQLVDDFRLVTWEPRGLGCSDRPDAADEPYTVDIWAEDLRDLLDLLGIERAHLWAQGFSTYYAVRFAARWPERVGAMVTYTDVWAADPTKGYLPVWNVYRAIVESFGTRAYGARVLAHVFDVPSPPWFYGWEQHNIERILHPETVAATVGYCLTEADVREDLAAVQAPVLVLQGDGGWHGDGTNSGEDLSLDLMRARLKSVEVSVIADAHPGYVLIQKPDECVLRVREFVGRVAGARP